MTQQPRQPPKKSRLQTLKDLIRPRDPTERIADANVVMREYGFVPIFNIRDTEQRRSEVITALQALEETEYQIRIAKNPALLRIMEQQLADLEKLTKKTTDPTTTKQLQKQITETKKRVTDAKSNLTIQQLQEKSAFQAYKLAKLFNLFFATGSPWIRGLDNSDLSNAVACYIMNYEDFGHLPSALPDLHAESMQLLHLSWQGIDVTNTPPYLIQVPTVLGGGPRINLAGGQPGSGTTEATEPKSEDL